MFNLTTPEALGTISKYVRDEIHLTGGLDGNPRAVITFIPCDSDGNRLGKDVATVRLTNEAYNYWFSNWNTEKDAMQLLKTCSENEYDGLEVSCLSLSAINVPSTVDEILAPCGTPSNDE